MNRNMADIPIGIDLGTTYSCLAVFRGGGAPEVIPNRTGQRTTPSYVAYVDDTILVGDKAKSQAFVNPENTIFDVKRLIGRKFTDQTVQDDIKIWPFEVVEGDKDSPMIKLNWRGEEKLIHPVGISARILSFLKDAAQEYLGQEVKRAVVTVPSYFNDHQREDTKNAAIVAGLEVMRIINEPTAAALAYGLHLEMKPESQLVVIFDFGGGTFDVTVMLIEDDVFTVKSTSGDTHLGGEDFTGRLVTHCVKYAKTNLEIDVSYDKRALGRIRVACEDAKRQLTDQDQWEIEVPNITDGKNFLLTVSVDDLEKMTEDLFARLAPPLLQALSDAEVEKTDVDQVVLVGGATRMRRVRSWVRDFFDGLEPVQRVNTDEAVACGAALQAFKLAGNVEEGLQSALTDVVPLSLGVDDAAGDVHVVIKRNTPIPVESSLEYTTFYDDQGAITFDLFEGERPLREENNHLGSFCISGLTLGPRGQVTVDVTIKVNSDGLCEVTGVEKREDENAEVDPLAKPSVLMIKNTARNSLLQADIQRMIVEAEIYKIDDNKEQNRLRKRSHFENMCLRLKSDIKYHKGQPLDNNGEEEVISICNKALMWLSLNKDAKEEDIQNNETEVKQELKKIFDAN